MSTALLLIDIQESFRSRPYWDETELPAFLAAVQHLIDEAQRRGQPIVQIFHEQDGGKADPFDPANGQVRTLAGLRVPPCPVFRKTVHSALYARDAKDQNLDDWLSAQGVTGVVISGIRTEQCCETTTRHASDNGLDVIYALDATLTFAMQARSGRVYTPAELRERTELVLEGRFARVVPAAQAWSL
ncbi:hydrolase [Bordetella genomosp. 1]|uniref:Hydrolase n=1 Tax=Bordetella genomosp. 1 TaxID=1395607 RepID=A0A261SUP1_9BORD|nr:isochorismatase family protein [Bordetella genomosp. 1]OZI40811.1 hydrolase [Bordetella genomosp. 1]OZI69007.1 hydrolase [Bordetella genomosp. 1]